MQTPLTWETFASLSLFVAMLDLKEVLLRSMSAKGRRDEFQAESVLLPFRLERNVLANFEHRW